MPFVAWVLLLSSRLVGDAQWFFSTAPGEASRLFDASPALTWSTAVVGEQAINDLWFSESQVVMDLSGSLVIGDRASGEATPVNSLGGASGRAFSSALVVGADVFVSSWQGGRTGRCDLYRSAHTNDRAKLAPALLTADVPPLSQLVLANGRLVGIYMIAPPTVRAGALEVDVASGEVLKSELPNGYSWGYELYPAEAALWGAITAGPMIAFETIARVPYSSLIAR